MNRSRGQDVGRPSIMRTDPVQALNVDVDIRQDGQPRNRLLTDITPMGGRHDHKVQWKQYLVLLYWMLLLTAQYLLTQAVCSLGIPHDCHVGEDPIEIMHDFQVMYTLGFIIAVFTGVPLEDRAAYLFCFRGPRPRGFAFIAVFLLSGPVWGSLDLVPLFQKLSLTAASMKSSWTNDVLAALIVGGAIFLVAWHFHCAYKHNPLQGFLAYSLSRFAVCLFYFSYLSLAASTTDVDVHLHHYVVGFLVALLAEFNHPISMVLLAAGSGIFVQGISAYEAAPVVVPDLVQFPLIM